VGLEHDPELTLRLAAALYVHWRYRGQWREARSWLERALGAGEAGPPAARARALFGLGECVSRLGEHEAGTRLLERSRALAAEVGDAELTAQALYGLGAAAYRRGDYALARATLGQSLTHSRALGNRAATARTLGYLGLVLGHEGDLAEARTVLEESVRIARELPDVREVGVSLGYLGDILLELGEHGPARSAFAESLESNRRTSSPLFIPLEGLASVAAAEGRAARALRLAGAASAARDEMGNTLPVGRRAQLERRLASARSRLGEEAAAAAWAEGRAMAPADAIASALGDEADFPP
jgi:tetratricopeptide (TPR) repeat protein